MKEQPDLLPDAPVDLEASLANSDLRDVPQTKWAGQLAEFVRVVSAHFERQGHAVDQADSLACAAVLAIAEYAGGRVIYLPRGDRLRTALRDAEIHHRWTRGATIEALAGHYKVTSIQIYRIIAAQRALHLRRTQGTLFEG